MKNTVLGYDMYADESGNKDKENELRYYVTPRDTFVAKCNHIYFDVRIFQD